jgi:hypothetical protein
MAKPTDAPFYGLEPDTAAFMVQCSGFKLTYNWSAGADDADSIAMTLAGEGHSNDGIIKLLGTHHTISEFDVRILPEMDSPSMWQSQQARDHKLWDANATFSKPMQLAIIEYHRAIHAKFEHEYPTAYFEIMLKEDGNSISNATLFIFVTRQVWGLIMSQLEKGKDPKISGAAKWESALTNRRTVLPGEPLTFGMIRLAATPIPICGRIVSLQVQI